MPTIRENILANIKTTLEMITIANGYSNNMSSVQRWLQRGNSLVSIPCIIINAGPEDKEPTPNPLTTCKFSIFLDVWTRQEESDSQATDTILNSLLGDIEKALMVDYTRGGYAIDTNIRSIVPFETTEGNPACGLIIEVEIIYQHQQTDPAVAG